MDSAEVGRGLESLRALARVGEVPWSLVDDSLSGLLALIAAAMDADAKPTVDFVKAGMRAIMLSDALSRMSLTQEVASIHYIVAMALEQAAFAASTIDGGGGARDPLEDDTWIRLALAVLHYLAGGYRVQSFAALARLRQLAREESYREGVTALVALLEARDGTELTPRWRRMLFGDVALPGPVERHLTRLAKLVRGQRVMMLEQLGASDPSAWLQARQVLGENAPTFWIQYVESLRNRGVVAFSREQVGDGFDYWLRPNADLIAILPTGAGKSIVGELRTALALADGRSVLWMLPTRALVRQTQRMLRRAFRSLGVPVRELPATEDSSPLFDDESSMASPQIACTTPERVSALFRARPDAMRGVGLVVLDEAQILVAPGRGAVAEKVVTELREHSQAECVFLSAFDDAFDPLHGLLSSRGEPLVLRANSRPTRRVYGVVSRVDAPRRHIRAVFYAPQRSASSSSPVFTVSLRVKSAGQTALDAAMRFARAAGGASLRTAVFVSRKDSAEKHASEFVAEAGSRYVGNQFPAPLVPRVAMELGRESVLQEGVPRGAVPHHAGMARLEQHLAEQLVLSGYVGTVVATPTLAQGVNLPIDISIVTFLTRFDPAEDARQPLEPSELHNMLGRAGRAGMVPDGICLIAGAKTRETARGQLARFRKWVYPSATKSRTPGVIQLLEAVSKVSEFGEEWLWELNAMGWSDVQSILAFGASFAQRQAGGVREQLLRFPSFARLESAERDVHVKAMERFVVVLRKHAAGPVLDLVAKTGLPFEYVKQMLDAVDRAETLDLMSNEWWDERVVEALAAQREWCSSVRLFQPISTWQRAIAAWRAGCSVAEVEASWDTANGARAHRVKSGQYFNGAIGQVAGFWGIAPLVLESVGRIGIVDEELKGMAASVREGVPSVGALLWLRALGGMDRVLATRLSQAAPLDAELLPGSRFRLAEELLAAGSGMWGGLDSDVRDALKGAVEEQEMIRDWMPKDR